MVLGSEKRKFFNRAVVRCQFCDRPKSVREKFEVCGFPRLFIVFIQCFFKRKL